MLNNFFCEGRSLSHVQNQRETGLSVPQELSGNLMWEKILFRLFDSYLQRQHCGQYSKKWLLALSLHQKDLSMQELLYEQKRALQYFGDGPSKLSL